MLRKWNANWILRIHIISILSFIVEICDDSEIVSKQRFCDLCGKGFPVLQEWRNQDLIYTCIHWIRWVIRNLLQFEILGFKLRMVTFKSKWVCQDVTFVVKQSMGLPGAITMSVITQEITVNIFVNCE